VRCFTAVGVKSSCEYIREWTKTSSWSLLLCICFVQPLFLTEQRDPSPSSIFKFHAHQVWKWTLIPHRDFMCFAWGQMVRQNCFARSIAIERRSLPSSHWSSALTNSFDEFRKSDKCQICVAEKVRGATPKILRKSSAESFCLILEHKCKKKMGWNSQKVFCLSIPNKSAVNKFCL